MEPVSKEADLKNTDTRFSGEVVLSIETSNAVRILSSLTRLIGSYDKISESYLILEVSSHSLPFGGCRPHTGEFRAEVLLGQC